MCVCYIVILSYFHILAVCVIVYFQSIHAKNVGLVQKNGDMIISQYLADAGL